jgi:endo-1,4-beta-xylanase
VEYTGRAIVNQDGTPHMPNHPVDYGMDVVTEKSGKKTGFTVTLAMKNIRKSAVIQLYGKVPIILDEDRYDPSSVRISLEGDRLSTDGWSCSGQDTPAQRSEVGIADRAHHTLQLEDARGRLAISVDGDHVETVDDQGVAATGKLWLGVDSNDRGGSYALTKLRVTSATTGKALKTEHPLDHVYSHLDPNGLRSLVAKVRPGFKIGAAVSIGPLVSDSRYRRELVNNFNEITLENAGKPQFVEPRPNQFFFGEADQLAAFARRNGMVVHYHTAIFGEANPEWLTRTARTSPQKMLSFEKSLVQHDVAHHQPDTTSIDVLDEPQNDSSSQLLRHDIWYDSIGTKYLSVAVRTARRYNPRIEVDLNDYGDEGDNDRFANLYTILHRLKVAQRAPVGGFGFEAHVYNPGDAIDPAVLKRNMERLAHLGIKSRISEIDVEADDGPALQNRQFAPLLKMCLLEKACESYTTWGVNNTYGSTSHVGTDGYHVGNGYLFNADGTPVPAYFLMQKMLHNLARR